MNAKLRPAANAIRDLAAEFLPDSTIVLGLGKKSRLGKDVNGAVISAGKTHFIGMAPNSSPTNGLLTGAHDQPARDAPLWLLTAATTLVVWRTRLHLLWLIGAGALLGALGWV